MNFRNKIICIGIATMMAVLSANLIGCKVKNNKHPMVKEKVLEDIKNNQVNAFTEILYASEKRVIIYGSTGLIVYDIENSNIYRALNLSDINMNHIQGSVTTIFKVNKDGSKILMYNDDLDHLQDKDKYLYDVEKDKLEKTNTDSISNEYTDMKYFEDGSDEEYEGYEVSVNYCEINEDEICYLIFPSNEAGVSGIGNLQIVIKKKNTNIEQKYNVFN